MIGAGHHVTVVNNDVRWGLVDPLAFKTCVLEKPLRRQTSRKGCVPADGGGSILSRRVLCYV